MYQPCTDKVRSSHQGYGDLSRTFRSLQRSKGVKEEWNLSSDEDTVFTNMDPVHSFSTRGSGEEVSNEPKTGLIGGY